MNKTLGAGAAALMTVTVLAGCGGSGSSSGGSYCDDIKTASNQLSGLGSGSSFTAGKFDAVNTAVHKIADEAPSTIKSQWTIVADQFDALIKAISDAGLSMDDFGKLSQGGTPPSIDPAKLTALTNALKNFDAQGLSAATSKIQTQVKSDCNFDLNKSTSTTSSP